MNALGGDEHFYTGQSRLPENDLPLLITTSGFKVSNVVRHYIELQIIIIAPIPIVLLLSSKIFERPAGVGIRTR